MWPWWPRVQVPSPTPEYGVALTDRRQRTIQKRGSRAILTFESKTVSDIPVLCPKGELLGDAENRKLHLEILRLIETRPKAIIIDLQEVEFMISAGLGFMIAEYRKAKDLGVKMLLANSPERVKELLFITHLDAFLKDYGALDNALAEATGGDDSTE